MRQNPSRDLPSRDLPWPQSLLTTGYQVRLADRCLLPFNAPPPEGVSPVPTFSFALLLETLGSGSGISSIFLKSSFLFSCYQGTIPLLQLQMCMPKLLALPFTGISIHHSSMCILWPSLFLCTMGLGLSCLGKVFEKTILLSCNVRCTSFLPLPTACTEP